MKLLGRGGEGAQPSGPPQEQAISYEIDVDLLKRPEQPRLLMLEGGDPIVDVPLPDAASGSPLLDAIEHALRSGQAVTIVLDPVDDGC